MLYLIKPDACSQFPPVNQAYYKATRKNYFLSETVTIPTVFKKGVQLQGIPFEDTQYNQIC